MKDTLDQVLSRLTENEAAVSRLYLQFSETFPDDAEFWRQLAAQEQKHAEWIQELRRMTDNPERKKLVTTLSSEAIDASITHINSICERCRNETISKEYALSTAYGIEDSLVEKEFFAAFDIDSEVSYAIRNNLTQETEQHLDLLEKALKNVSPSPP